MSSIRVRADRRHLWAFVAVLALVPVLVSLVLVMRYGAETRGRDLRDLEARPD